MFGFLIELESNRKSFYLKSIIDEYNDEDGKPGFRILKNNINFCDRASQTSNNPFRVLLIA